VDTVRTEGSFLYEEYLDIVSNLDVKVYVVNDYVYAECRKAPSTDGIVERGEDGKEKRFSTILTEKEKEMARNTAKAFKHFICGLDILRTKEGSFVCDVNGMSFVKTNTEYYDQCAEKLIEWMCKE
jgi:inositol-hexakisphosphate/diphosphoinositol-pentakisphosphate 1-kinase